MGNNMVFTSDVRFSNTRLARELTRTAEIYPLYVEWRHKRLMDILLKRDHLLWGLLQAGNHLFNPSQHEVRFLYARIRKTVCFAK